MLKLGSIQKRGMLRLGRFPLLNICMAANLVLARDALLFIHHLMSLSHVLVKPRGGNPRDSVYGEYGVCKPGWFVSL